VQLHCNEGGRAELLVGGHTGCVEALATHPKLPLFATASRDGTVRFWNAESRLCLCTHPLPRALKAIAAHFHPSGGMLAVGGERAEVVILELNIAGPNPGQLMARTLAEMTTADDMYKPEESAAQKKQKEKRMLRRAPRNAAGDAMTGFKRTTGDNKTWAQGGGKAARAKKRATLFKDLEEVQDLKFSPNGRWLAACSRDNYIYLFAAELQWKKVAVLKGHSSFALHVDWSVDSTRLQTNDGAHEILFWEVKVIDKKDPPPEPVKKQGQQGFGQQGGQFGQAAGQFGQGQGQGGQQQGQQQGFGQQKKKGKPPLVVRATRCESAYEVRQTEWATWTCALGWPVQGIWPPGADGTDVNSVARSHDGLKLVTADDFNTVKIFNWPASGNDCNYHRHVGHMSHVMNVRWTCEDSRVVSVGGNDCATLVWKHVDCRTGNLVRGGAGAAARAKQQQGGQQQGRQHKADIAQTPTERRLAVGMAGGRGGGQRRPSRTPSRPPSQQSTASRRSVRFRDDVTGQPGFGPG